MDNTARIRSALKGGYTVSERPEPVPGDLRIGWGQSLLLLVLASSRGMRCSLQKVHFLAHLSRTEQSRIETREVLSRERTTAELSIRIEPWVNRAAAFAKASGLVELKEGKSLALTVAGKDAVKKIRSSGALALETAFLDEIGRLASEQVVEKIMKMETI